MYGNVLCAISDLLSRTDRGGMATTNDLLTRHAPAEHVSVITGPVVFDERAALDLLCFRNLMSSATDIVYFKDLESRYLSVSRGTAGSYGENDPLQEEGRTDFDHFTLSTRRRHARTSSASSSAANRCWTSKSTRNGRTATTPGS